MMCDKETDSYNCRVFSYSTGQHVTYYSNSINTGRKNENLSKTHHNEGREKMQEEHCKNVSLSRTKNKIYNIARSNTWDWFITLTFDRQKTDSSDYDEITKKLHTFLNNFQKRYSPNMKYLIIPELHKDKEHYHFHGLLSNVENMQFRFSGKYSKGQPIFNIVNWKLGFTTATRVADTQKVSSYITKYITKASEQYLKEKRRYYASRNIDRAEAEFFVIDEEDFLETYADRITYVKTVNVKEALQQVHYYELDY